MKKFIICILSILMLNGAVMAVTHTAVNLKSNPPASYSVWIKIIINFHRPKLDCQRGFGICLDFEVGTSKATGMGSDLCPAMARINASGQLELKVAETDLLKYENGSSLQYFKSGSITIQDGYTFSDPVTKLLVPGGQITIRPGSYPVAYDPTAQTYTVTIAI